MKQFKHDDLIIRRDQALSRLIKSIKTDAAETFTGYFMPATAVVRGVGHFLNIPSVRSHARPNQALKEKMHPKRRAG